MSDGFFNKYQRPILYTAGIFALVSFSITGPLLQWAESAFREKVPLGSIEVAGKRVELTEEDMAVGRELWDRESRRGDMVFVLPNLFDREASGDRREVEVFAILRRAAIEEGIEVSDIEVDRAIATTVAIRARGNTDGTALTPVRYATESLGYSSLEKFREVIREAMRIGNYIRLEFLGVDLSDAAIVESLIEDNEKITLRVAEIDSKAIEDELKETEISDEDLRSWIDGLEDNDKDRYGFRDTNRVTLQLAVLDFASEDFQSDQFTAELEGVSISDDELTSVYDTHKDWFKKPEEPKDGDPDESGPPGPEEATQDPEPEYLPFEDVREQLQRRMLAREVMRKLWTKVNEELRAALDESRTEEVAAVSARLDAQAAYDEAQTAADGSPDDADLAAARDAAKEALDAAEAAAEAALAKVDEARAAFDVEAAFRTALGDRGGAAFRFVSTGDPKNATQLEEIEGAGRWGRDSWAGPSHQKVGELSSNPQDTDQVVFQYRVTEIIERPLKAFDDIAETARASYYTSNANDLAADRVEAFEAALERLAGEARTAEIEKLRAAFDADVDERFAEWQTETQEKLAEANTKYETLRDDPKRGPESKATQQWLAERDRLQAEIDGADAKRTEFVDELQEQLDTDLDEERRSAWPEVLEAAAGEAEVTIHALDPLPRNLANRGQPRDLFSDPVQFFFFTRPTEVRELEEGESTDVVQDLTNRKHYLAVCDAVTPATLGDLTRRELLQNRDLVRRTRLQEAILQSYSIEALEQRLKFEAPGDASAGPLAEQND